MPVPRQLPISPTPLPCSLLTRRVLPKQAAPNAYLGHWHLLHGGAELRVLDCPGSQRPWREQHAYSVFFLLIPALLQPRVSTWDRPPGHPSRQSFCDIALGFQAASALVSGCRRCSRTPSISSQSLDTPWSCRNPAAITTAMSGLLQPDALPERESIKTNRSRRSIAATLRRKTSRLFGGSKGDGDAHPKHKRHPLGSISLRFSRHAPTVLDASPQGSRDDQSELGDLRDMASTPSASGASASSAWSPRSPVRARPPRVSSFGLLSLPRRNSRQGTAEHEVVSVSSASSVYEEEDKENTIPFLTIPPARRFDTEDSSSFCSDVQRAVQGRQYSCLVGSDRPYLGPRVVCDTDRYPDAIDNRFRCPEGYDRLGEHADVDTLSSCHDNRRTDCFLSGVPHSHARVPLKSLWTIMAADLSECVASFVISSRPRFARTDTLLASESEQRSSPATTVSTPEPTESPVPSCLDLRPSSPVHVWKDCTGGNEAASETKDRPTLPSGAKDKPDELRIESPFEPKAGLVGEPLSETQP